MGTVQGTTRELWNCEGLNPCQPEIMSVPKATHRPAGSDQRESAADSERSRGSFDGFKPKGHQPPTAIRDPSILYQELMKDPKDKSGKYSDHHHEIRNKSNDWTERDDAELELAVRKVSSLSQSGPPKYQDLDHDLADGRFTDEKSRDYWHCVSMRVRSRDAAACFLRYKAMHGRVARFIAPPSQSGCASYHAVDDILRRHSAIQARVAAKGGGEANGRRRSAAQ